MLIEELVETFPTLGECRVQLVTYVNGLKVKRIFWDQFSKVAHWKVLIMHDPSTTRKLFP